MTDKEFIQNLEKQKSQVNEALNVFFELEKHRQELRNGPLKNKIPQIKNYVLNDGKRIRAILTLETIKAIKKENKNFYTEYQLSCAPEIFHNSTLIADDVMDKSLLRRGKPAYHTIHGENFAMVHAYLVDKMTDDILKEVFGENTLEYNTATCLFEKTKKKVYEGQERDEQMSTSQLYKTNQKKYIQMISEKTAQLLVCCVELGAIYTNAKPEQMNQLRNFALNAGIAFQIRDDILDNDEKKGNDIHKDIIDGKKTILPILAYRLGDANTKYELNGFYSDSILRKRNIEYIYEEHYKYSIVEHKASELAEKYTKKAIDSLDPNMHNYEFFRNFANLMVERKN